MGRYLDLARKTESRRRLVKQEELEPLKKSGVKARDELDLFFTKEILHRLTSLQQAGMLQKLPNDQLWTRIEALWQTAAEGTSICDVELVKLAMIKAIERYEQAIPETPAISYLGIGTSNFRAWALSIAKGGDDNAQKA